MRGRRWTMALLVAAVVVGAFFVSQVFRARRPYVVRRSDLSGWQVVTGRPGGAVAVGLRPPQSLTDGLYAQVTGRARSEVTAPPQAIVPLVLREEFDGSLMGVLSTDQIVEIARESGIESASFEPVCMAEHADESSGDDERLFFVLFESPDFEKARAELMLMHPEHGGAIDFDPNALSPILAVAATDDRFARWWRLLPRDQSDCRIGMRTE